MAPKHQRGEGSASSRAYDKKRFVSAEAAEKFDTYLAGKVLTPERGLRPDELLDGEMAHMIAERGWEGFTDQPEPAVMAIVKEFYANAMDTPQCEVIIRGKIVSFSRQVINEYYNLRGYDNSEYAWFLLEGPDYAKIVRELCKPETDWKTRNQGGAMTFPFANLSRYGKIWYAFLCAKLMPSTHVSDVTKERAVLLYAIVTGMKFDVGDVIQASIKKNLKGATSGGLPHPSLICGLCKKAGVRWGADELLQPPAVLLDHALIGRYKIWEGGESHPRGLGFITCPPWPQAEEDPMVTDHATAADSATRAPSTFEDPSSREFGVQFRRLQSRMDQQYKKIVRQNRRLAERQEVIHSYNVKLYTAVADMFARMNPSAEPIRFPDPPTLPVYPPPDSDDEEVDHDA